MQGGRVGSVIYEGDRLLQRNGVLTLYLRKHAALVIFLLCMF